MRWVRAVISLIFALGITIGFFLDKLPPEAFIGLAGVAIAWWYRSRDEEKKTVEKS